MNKQPGAEPDRINLNNTDALSLWIRELNVTEEQLREAVAAVGDKAANVELHLKGSRSSSNSDRVRQAGGSGTT